MNVAHKIGKLRNRLSRCKKRLTDKEMPGDQRARVQQRAAELEAELSRVK